MSSRHIPRATQSLIFWIFSGVNLVVRLPLGVAFFFSVIMNPYDGSAPWSVVAAKRFRVHVQTLIKIATDTLAAWVQR